MSGTAEQGKYEYRPLRAGPNNIRLIQILPGVGDAGIVCEVFQYTLRNDKAFGLYEALSYVWGDYDKPRHILVKNSEDLAYRNFTVTQNLYTALRRLRDPDLPRTFWIDAICINQNDLEERATQVQIMARIYAYATSVSVWLGEEANESSHVFDLLQDMYSEDLKFNWLWRDEMLAKLLPSADSIQNLLDRPWFRRAWVCSSDTPRHEEVLTTEQVVQEAAVARVVSVACGNAEIPGGMFARGLQVALWKLEHMTEEQWALPAVLGLMNHTTSNLPLLQRISTLQMSTAIPSFEIAPLGELLRMFVDHEATDERDRIYALLGLSSDNDLTPDLRPDYTKSWSDLFRQVIKHILGSSAIISVVDGKSQAVISDFGYTIAYVTKHVGDQVTVQSPWFGETPGYRWEATWAVHGNFERGDILVYLQGARRPSIVRGCRDHFDIIAISVPPPIGVSITDTEQDDDEFVATNYPWTNILEGARSTSRKFTMVWDWTSQSQHNETDHVTWIESEPGTHPNFIERCSNTARVLDDLRLYIAICKLLAVRPRSATATAEEEHLILLEHVCACRTEYTLTRRYLEDVQWSMRMLDAPINSRHLEDYWRRYGYLGMDLYDIVQLAKTHQESAEKLGSAFDPYARLFERDDEFLYPLLFPKYHPIKYKSKAPLSTERALSPHNGRYLMRLVVASEPNFSQPSDGVLERARTGHAVYKEYTKLPIMLAILKEHPSTHLDMDTAIRHVFEQDGHPVVDCGHLIYLLRELSGDSALTFDLLEHLVFHMQNWNLPQLKDEVFIPLVDVFARHIKDMTLCHMEILMWRNAHKPFHSVLSFLYTKYSTSRPELVSQLSRHNNEKWYSTDSLIRWAQKAILRAIVSCKKRQRLRQRGYRSPSVTDSGWSDASSQEPVSDEESITFGYPEEDPSYVISPTLSRSSTSSSR